MFNPLTSVVALAPTGKRESVIPGVGMRPFSVILGILLGSLVSIAFGLAVVVLVFWLLQDEYDRFAAEMPALLRRTGIFAGLATIGAAAFVGTLYRRRWRYGMLAIFWTALAATGWHYWPY